jgi:hypothetical protein
MQEDVQELENKAIYEGGGWFKPSVAGKVDDLINFLPKKKQDHKREQNTKNSA